MNKIESTIPELLNMLKTVEPSVKHEQGTVLLVDSSKKGSKRKSKQQPKGKKKKKGKKAEPAQKGTCHHCGKEGHWRRNCKIYLESLKKNKASDAPSSSGIFVIDCHSISFDTWVLDTGCGSHICNDIQGLRHRRRLVKGESNLRIGNGAKVAAVAIGTYMLKLPTGRVLVLDNCF